jgi:hypothetical protein
MPENMFQNTPYRLFPLARCVLAKLYAEHVNDNDVDAFSIDEVKATFSVPVSRNLIGSALEELYGSKNSNNSVLHRFGAKRSEWRYKINSAGIQRVEKALRDSSSDIAYFFKHGDTALNDIAGIDGIFWTPEEHLDRSGWSELELEDDAAFKEAIKGLDQTISEIEKNNEFEATDPDQKQGLLATLQQGLSSLKTKRVSRNQVNGLIIQPLRWLATTFASTLMGSLAKATAEKIIKLLLSSS